MSLHNLAAFVCVVVIEIVFVVSGLCVIGVTILLNLPIELVILVALLWFLLVLGAGLGLAEFYKEIRD
jgi:cytosine/uracil/thiamine/allantoin permease